MRKAILDSQVGDLEYQRDKREPCAGIMGEPPGKAKYFLATDSELVP